MMFMFSCGKWKVNEGECRSSTETTRSEQMQEQESLGWNESTKKANKQQQQ